MVIFCLGVFKSWFSLSIWFRPELNDSAGCVHWYRSLSLMSVAACLMVNCFLGHSLSRQARGHPRLKSKKSHSDPQKDTVMKRGRKEVIHPYLVYVIESQNEECSNYGFCDWRVVGAEYSPVIPPSEKKFAAGIFSGSLAGDTSTAHPKGYLKEELRKIPQLNGKEIVIQPLCLVATSNLSNLWH